MSDPASDGSREVVYVVNDAGEPVKGAQAAKTIAQVPEKEMKKILGVKVRLKMDDNLFHTINKLFQ